MQSCTSFFCDRKLDYYFSFSEWMFFAYPLKRRHTALQSISFFIHQLYSKTSEKQKNGTVSIFFTFSKTKLLHRLVRCFLSQIFILSMLSRGRQFKIKYPHSIFIPAIQILSKLYIFENFLILVTTLQYLHTSSNYKTRGEIKCVAVR